MWCIVIAFSLIQVKKNSAERESWQSRWGPGDLLSPSIYLPLIPIKRKSTYPFLSPFLQHRPSLIHFYLTTSRTDCQTLGAKTAFLRLRLCHLSDVPKAGVCWRASAGTIHLWNGCARWKKDDLRSNTMNTEPWYFHQRKQNRVHQM